MKNSKKLEEEGLNIIKNIQERIEENENNKRSEKIGKVIFSAGLQILKNRSKKLRKLGKKDKLRELAKFIQDTKATMNEIDKKSKNLKEQKVKPKAPKQNFQQKKRSKSYNYFDDEINSPKAKMWKASDKKNKVQEFFVYILSLVNEPFYIGHTADLRARMMEHRDGNSPSTKNKKPKLVYFEKFSERKVATKYERDLKILNKKNPRAIRQIILKFKSNIDELG
tara:strand:- start:64 stop:735 length:672 start_codon:yes stop_codon:yes gene_type:complete